MNRFSIKMDTSKLLVFGLVLFSFSHKACEPKIQPLKLATYTYATNNRISNLEPLSRELEKVLERPVHIKSYPNALSFIDGIRLGEVDIALINTLGYLLLSLDTNESLISKFPHVIQGDFTFCLVSWATTRLNTLPVLDQVKSAHRHSSLSSMEV